MIDRRILVGWKAIAEFLGVHTHTVQGWAKSSGLPIAKVDGSIMTTRNALEAWVEKNLKNRR